MLADRAAQALLSAVDAFLESPQSAPSSPFLRDETHPATRLQHIAVFGASVRAFFAPPSQHELDLLDTAFDHLCHTHFDTHLLSAVRCIIDKLFVHHARFDPRTPVPSLRWFHWKLQCWFFLRDALHSFLRPFRQPSVETCLVLDNCLIHTPLFGRLLIDVQSVHTALCNSLRLTPSVNSPLSLRSVSLSCAIKSMYYFLQHYMYPTPADDRALAHYRTQLYHFYADHPWKHIVQTFELACDNPSYPNKLSHVEQFIAHVHACRGAELFISLHAFGNRHHDASIILESQLGNCRHYRLFSEHFAAHSTRLLNSNTRLLNAFSWVRALADFGSMQTFMRHFHSLVSKPPEPSSTSVSVTSKQTKTRLFYLIKYHSFQDLLNRRLACMKHLKRQLEHAIWDVLQNQITGVDRAHVLLRLFDRVLQIPRDQMWSELNEYPIDIVFRAIASLSVSPLLNESEHLRFISDARKLLAERFVNGRNTHKYEEAESSLRKAHHFNGSLVTFEEVNAADFRNLSLAKLPSYHQPEPAPVKLISTTFIDSEKCAIEVSGQFLKVPQELEHVQKVVSSFYQKQHRSRTVSHVNYLSIVELSTSFFAEGDSPILFLANVYQACVLKLFEENLSLRYQQIVERLLKGGMNEEQYNEQKVRIRQALLSLSTERAPLLKCEEGSGSNQNLSFELNAEWKTSSLNGLPSLYADAYLSSLDRKEERKLRALVEPAIYKSLVDSEIDIEQNVVEKVLAQHLHPYMTSDFVRACIERLLHRGRLRRHVVTDELCLPRAARSFDSNGELD